MKKAKSGAVKPRNGKSRAKNVPIRTANVERTRERWHDAIIVDYIRFRRWPGVERVGLGMKEIRNRHTKKYSVKIYVREKGEPADPGHRFPAKTRVLLPVGKGMFKTRWVPTDVVAARTVVLCSGASNYFDPIRAGAQIGRPGNEVGTLACIVKDSSGNLLGLTAGHVVSSSSGPVPKDNLVDQPLDSASASRLGYTVDGFVGNQDSIGYVDWATVTLERRQFDGNRAWEPAFTFTKQILPEADITNGAPAAETLGGFTNERRRGTFSARFWEVTLKSGEVLHNLTEFASEAGTTLAQRGDSGALVVSRANGSDGEVIGIVCAASDPPDNRAYVVPFARIPGLVVA
ncbi:MAG: hypothetical protein ABSH28_01825 [Acidobacteriota bacterium]|jgi:hypothetical protein